MFTKAEINKLNVMNYHVSQPDNGFYYLCDGVAGLATSTFQWDIDLVSLMRGLLADGQVETPTGHVITMI